MEGALGHSARAVCWGWRRHSILQVVTGPNKQRRFWAATGPIRVRGSFKTDSANPSSTPVVAQQGGAGARADARWADAERARADPSSLVPSLVRVHPTGRTFISRAARRLAPPSESRSPREDYAAAPPIFPPCSPPPRYAPRSYHLPRRVRRALGELDHRRLGDGTGACVAARIVPELRPRLQPATCFLARWQRVLRRRGQRRLLRYWASRMQAGRSWSLRPILGRV